MSGKCKAGFKIEYDKCKRCGATTNDTCPVSLQRAGEAFDEMLETLREAVEVLEIEVPRGNPTIERMRNAIAKAEGAK